MEKELQKTETYNVTEKRLVDDLEKQDIGDDTIFESEKDSVSEDKQQRKLNQITYKTCPYFFSIFQPFNFCYLVFNNYFYQFFLFKPHDIPTMLILFLLTVVLVFLENVSCIWRMFTKRTVIKHTLTCVIVMAFILKMVVVTSAIAPFVRQIPWGELYERVQSFLKN